MSRGRQRTWRDRGGPLIRAMAARAKNLMSRLPGGAGKPMVGLARKPGNRMCRMVTGPESGLRRMAGGGQGKAAVYARNGQGRANEPDQGGGTGESEIGGQRAGEPGKNDG